MSKIKYSNKYKHVFSYGTVSGTLYGFRFPYYDNNEVRHEKQKRKFETEESAYKDLLKVQLDIANNNIASVSSSEMTFEQWSKQWLESKLGAVKPSTYSRYKTVLTYQINPLIGKQKLSELNKITYQRLVITPLVQKGLLKKTILNYNSVTMNVINSAVDNEIIVRNKLSGVSIPNTGKLERRIMTESELKIFNQQLKKAPLRIQAGIMLLEYTGMRKGEALGLRWADIDFDNQKISIKRTRDKFGARSPKTQSGRRDVTANDKLLHILRQYRTETIAVALQQGRGAIVNKDSYVLLSRLCKPMNESHLRYNLKSLLKSAGLKSLIDHFTLHTFRHMYGSYLVANGKNIVAISKELGHEDPSITLRIYSHVIPGSEDNMSQDFLNSISN